MGLHDRLSGGAAAVAEATAAAPRVDPYAELKVRVHHACIAKLGPEVFNGSPEDLNDAVYRAVTEELALTNTPLTREERRELVSQLTDDILGYGPLERFLADDSVTEVMVNGAPNVFVERGGKIERTEARFVDDAHLMRIIDKIVSQVGRRVDESSPMVDARLPDGSRVNAIIPPLALDGASMSIRRSTIFFCTFGCAKRRAHSNFYGFLRSFFIWREYFCWGESPGEWAGRKVLLPSFGSASYGHLAFIMDHWPFGTHFPFFWLPA